MKDFKDMFINLHTMPEEYDVLRLHLTATNKWDVLTTLLHVNLYTDYHTETDDEIIVESRHIIRTIVKGIHRNKSTVYYNYFMKFWEMMERIPYPRKRIEIHIHDVMVYLQFVQLAAVKDKDFYDKAIKGYYEYPVEIILGDPQLAVEFEEWVCGGKGYMTGNDYMLTMEQLNLVDSKFAEKQRKIRVSAGVWNA